MKWKIKNCVRGIFKSIGLIVLILSLQSCLAFILIKKFDPDPSFQHDEIKNTSVYQKLLYYRIAEELNSPFRKNEQIVIKEQAQFQNQYTVFDHLFLSTRISSIENTIYFIVDQKSYPIEISHQDHQNVSEIDEDDIDNFSLISAQYTISEELISKIVKAHNVSIRYYTNPEKITLHLSAHKIKSFTALLNAQFEEKTLKQAFE